MSETYPPKHHLLRDLDLRFVRSDATFRVFAAGDAALHNRAGSLSASALGTVVDILGGNLSLRTVAPDWCLTSSLGVHLLRPLTGDYQVEGVALRAGKTSVVAEIRANESADPDASPALLAHTGFSRIPRRHDTPHFSENDDAEFRFEGNSAVSDEPFFTRLGIRTVEPGTVEMPVVPYVRNSVGAVQGGASIAMVDAAAESIAADRMEADVVTTDLQIHYLATGRDGPMRSRTEWLGGNATDARLRVELLDVGREDRLVSVSNVRLGRLAG
ncbi:MAG: PaaI family thioesterase [Myxococcota bacterium]